MSDIEPHQLRHSSEGLANFPMPKADARRAVAAWVDGVVDSNQAQGRTFAAHSYIDGAGLLAAQGGMWAERLARLEDEASTSRSQVRIAAINDAFVMLVRDEILNLRRGQ